LFDLAVKIPAHCAFCCNISGYVGEWLLTFWKYHLEARRDPDPARRPLEVILHPGEVIFVPHGYWHMVVNLEESVALTHNYVSTSNLSDVLRFLRDKVDQISGVRDRGGEAIAPEHMYTTFVDKLTTVLPKEVVQKHVQESLKPEKGALSDAAKAKLLLQRATRALKRKRGQCGGATDTAVTKVETANRKQPCGGLSGASSDSASAGVPKVVESGTKSAFSFGFAL
jgi:hypothetical protein